MEATYTQCKQLKELHGDSWGDILVEMADTPPWIDPLMIADIQAIQQGGCASGAYMPAVTYYTANQVMAEYGDDVIDFINDQYGEVSDLHNVMSYSGIAVFYLSTAVELWCGQFDLTDVNWD